MAVTTKSGEILADTAMARRSQTRKTERGASRRSILLILLLVIVAAMIAVIVFSGAILRLLPGRATAPQAAVSAAPLLSFVFPRNTPEDRILLRTGINVVLTHQETLPDKIVLLPPPGDLIGSFTWTVIPHQGSHHVRRLIGETEWQGRVYKLCEAIDDQDTGQPRYAERYFPVNNGGIRYRIPERTDPTPFITFLEAAIAQVPIGQQAVGNSPVQPIARLAERLIPLCTGQ